MSCLNRTACLVLILSLLGVTAASAEKVTFESLLKELTDLERLARVSQPAYITKQASSYDRRSTDPAVLTEENWFANGDRNQVLRVEDTPLGREHVLLDVEGPGALVRIWSANPNDGGIVRIYLDQQPEPLFEMPLQVMLGGGTKPFLEPIAHMRASGWNSYLPIPYAKHCKVTVSNPDIYYHINYRVYASGTEVETLTPEILEAGMPVVRETAKTLAEPWDRALPNRDGLEKTPYEVILAPGTSETLELTGPAAIREITCLAETMEPEKALRGILLEIAFDAQVPSVVAPLGDFFATAPGPNPYRSLSSGVMDDHTLYSRWVMPFRNQAVLRVTNHTDSEVTLRGSVGTGAWSWDDRSLYFHAKYKYVRDIPTRPFQDWNYLTVNGGPGRLAGVMLHVSNPSRKWWGEGDEKIYVDGESFPSHFGTGTEDYFGYAWCSPTIFTHAYHNQPRCDGPDNYGHSCVSRFHIIDDIPWNSSFRFDMELWHSDDVLFSQSVVAYWYAAAGSSDTFEPVSPAGLTVPEIEPIAGVAGAIEGEFMRVLSCSAGSVTRQSGPWDWSRGEQLWWSGPGRGATLQVGFLVPEAGRYVVFGRFTKGPDYGGHALKINGEEALKHTDFYSADVEVTEEIRLGEFDLRQGENILEVTCGRKNVKALPANMFGLNYLRLERP